MTLHLTKSVIILSSLVVLSCSIKNNESNVNSSPKKSVVSNITKPHPFGGWYCPDNLNGFPPVDYDNWKDVPVISGPFTNERRNKNSKCFDLCRSKQLS